jgi:hypothetical protein
VFAGRAKLVEKKAMENSKTTAPGQVVAAAGTAVAADVKPPGAVAVSLATMPPLLPEIPVSIATAGLIPPVVSTRSGDIAKSLAEADSTRSGAAARLAGEFQPNASPDKSGAILDSASSSAAVTGASKQMPADERASQTNAGAPAKPATPLPTGVLAPPVATQNESGASPSAPLLKGTTAPIVATPKSAETTTSESATVDVPAQRVEAPVTNPAETAAAPPPVPAIPTPIAMPPDVTDPTSGLTGNAFAEVSQTMSDGKLEAENLPPVLANPTQSAMPPAAIYPTSTTAIAATEAEQSTLEGKPQPDSGVSTISNIASTAEISKPVALPSAMVARAKETNPAADARPKETPTATASTNQVSSTEAGATRGQTNQGQTNQGQTNQAPTDREAARSKLADSPSNSVETNVPPVATLLSPSSVGGGNGGDPSSAAAASASLSAQGSPAANQDSGSRSAGLPAAQIQSAVLSPPTTIPTTSPVETARLVAGVAQSEMHIGLHTEAFGSVEVHTLVRDSQVGLTVGSERGDLRSFLAPEVSGLQTAFRQQDLRFDNIRFLETSSGTTAGFSGGSDSQPRSSSQQHSSSVGVFSIHSPPEDPADLDGGAGFRTRLNVHA